MEKLVDDDQWLVGLFTSTHRSCCIIFLFRYGMRYVAMTLRESLKEKFPKAQEDDILNVRTNWMKSRVQWQTSE